MIQFSGRRVILLACMLGLGTSILPGCATKPAIPPAERNRDRAGSVDLQVHIAPGVTLRDAVYGISGPGSFTKIGTIKVSDEAMPIPISGIPAGDGYAISILATEYDNATSCGGSAMFNVRARSTAPAAVYLTCHGTPINGRVAVNGTVRSAW